MKLIEVLGDMGVVVQQLNEHTWSFEASNVNLEFLRSEDFKKKGAALRGSIMIIGPLLARFGMAYIPEPGGDKIGRRPVDTHLRGFEALGATFEHLREERFYKINAKSLKGTYMMLDEASVTGTANIVMAASLTPGKTQIYNAACEPYLQQLCKMINRMGGKISGIGSNLITIEGVEALGGCTHRMLPDMIEIGSFIGLAAATQSEITIKDCSIPDLGIIPSVFRRMGIELEFRGDDIFIPSQESYKIQSLIDGSILTIKDGIWPAFTPDLISIALVTATQAKGSVLIHQWMFESRLFFVDNLIDMGAKIILCDPHRAVVIGSNRETKLRGITMSSPDIRAGVSMLIAAMAANGTSTINNIEQIDRGYQFIDKRLNAIGADITRID
jgi:UDP-N-acetylglucosamine 1-carboxyvinyltransferase